MRSEAANNHGKILGSITGVASRGMAALAFSSNGAFAVDICCSLFVRGVGCSTLKQLSLMAKERTHEARRQLTEYQWFNTKQSNVLRRNRAASHAIILV